EGERLMDDRGRYMISVAAELVGMHPQTLRVYEQKGLVRPKRTQGNTRLYSESDVERLRLIQRLTTELGLNLAGGELVLLLEQELPRELVPDADSLRAQAEATLSQKPRIQGAAQEPRASAQFNKILDKAGDEARRMEDDYVSSEALLLALDVVPRDQLLEK